MLVQTTSYLFIVMYAASGQVAGHLQVPTSMTLRECREQAARLTISQPFSGMTQSMTFACERRSKPPLIVTSVPRR